MNVKPLVTVIMGSKSDEGDMSACLKILRDFEIPFSAHIFSAHRTPVELFAHLDKSEKEGVKIIIAAAGMSAHLAGVIAAHTTLPVIGVPMESGPLKGQDALYSTVMMPPGIPVGTMGIGKSGATNAALFAVAILSISDNGSSLRNRLAGYRKDQAQKILSQKVEA